MELKGHLMETLIQSFQQLCWIFKRCSNACKVLIREPDSSLFQQHPSHSFPLALSLTSKDAGLFEAQACLFDFLYPENHTQPHNRIFFSLSDVAAEVSVRCFDSLLLVFELPSFAWPAPRAQIKGRTASEPRCSAKQTLEFFFDLLHIETPSKNICQLTNRWGKPRPTSASFCSSPPNLELTWWLRLTHKCVMRLNKHMVMYATKASLLPSAISDTTGSLTCGIFAERSWCEQKTRCRVKRATESRQEVLAWKGSRRYDTL